jgi:hypothetical protein
MHFVGKILVVLQLVLSIFFMAFAGVVWNTHVKWNEETVKQKKQVEKITKDLSDREEDIKRVTTQMDAQVKQAEGKQAVAEAENKNLKDQLARVNKELEDSGLAQKTFSQQSKIAGEEAEARHEESAVLRQIVADQAKARDAEFATRIKLEDQIRQLQLDLDSAKSKNRELLQNYSLAQQALNAAGITADVKELAARRSPPPVVEGVIQEIKKGKRQGASELVEISLGSDMGLQKGHEMTVYRTGLKGGQQARFLAKIVIVDTKPDKAIGQVIESTRNGIIQKGDNVTTKL